MGTDKALLHIHGEDQLTWTAALLAGFCQSVLVSARPDQATLLSGSKLQLIPDQHQDSGPLAGIVAAIHWDPAVAWLVVACDMPWLDTATLGQLVKHRDYSKPATAFVTSKGPEPLCTIWEPAALEPLANALKTGQHSPRRVLEQLAIRELVPDHPEALVSINTPELLKRARQDFG